MTTFSRRIRPHVDQELVAAARAEAAGHFHTATTHLERAHVLGQTSTVEHLRVHWRMFRLAARNRWCGHVAGQLWRLAAAALFTPLGAVPRGNTGWADVSGFRRMSVPDDLQRLIDDAQRGSSGRAARARAGAPRRAASLAVASAAALTLGACMSAPKDLDLSLDKPSAGALYRVVLTPPAVPPAINQLHSWSVKVTTPAGEPVPDMRIGVDGGMPQHGHGLPTQPRVTGRIGDGSYRIDGMKFSMTGWWEIKLALAGPLGDDNVTFNTRVDAPALQP